jgi:hypothetical protein
MRGELLGAISLLGFLFVGCDTKKDRVVRKMEMARDLEMEREMEMGRELERGGDGDSRGNLEIEIERNVLLYSTR